MTNFRDPGVFDSVERLGTKEAEDVRILPIRAPPSNNKQDTSFHLLVYCP